VFKYGRKPGEEHVIRLMGKIERGAAGGYLRSHLVGGGEEEVGHHQAKEIHVNGIEQAKWERGGSSLCERRTAKLMA